MAQLDLATAPGEEDTLVRMLRSFAGERINLTFLAMRPCGSSTAASLCLAQSQGSSAGEIALRVPGVRTRLTTLAPVVTASVFPHRSRGTILQATSRLALGGSLPLLALATSLSALTFTVSHAHLPRALDGLHRAFLLPENHSPLLPEPLATRSSHRAAGGSLETAAQYHEQVVRTYGFDLLADQTMVKVSWPISESSATWIFGGCAKKNHEQRLTMAVAGIEAGSSTLWVVAPGGSTRAFGSLGIGEACPAATRSVDVLRFHGPHFGDRHGIAAATLTALLEGDLWPLLVACTGASVHVALPRGAGEAAMATLSTRFCAPLGIRPKGAATP